MVGELDPEAPRREFEEEERRRAAEQGRRSIYGRSDDDVTRAEERLEWERRDRFAGIDRLILDMQRQLAAALAEIAGAKETIAGVIPGVKAVVNDAINGKLKDMRSDIDTLKTGEVGNRVVRGWFKATLYAIGVAAAITISGYMTGTIYRVVQFFTVSSAPVNPGPPVIPEQPAPPMSTREAYDKCRQWVNGLNFRKDIETQIIIERCGVVLEAPRGKRRP